MPGPSSTHPNMTGNQIVKTIGLRKICFVGLQYIYSKNYQT